MNEELIYNRLLPISLFALTSLLVILNPLQRLNNRKLKTRKPTTTYNSLIGNTPIVKCLKLSELTGRNIYLKNESVNPAGTGKDRAVMQMLDEAENLGLVSPGIDIIEGTSGSTGIALAFQCRARNYRLHIVMPDDQAQEKKILLEKLGAIVHIVPSCSIANPNHYVNRAKKLAMELNGFFVNQFENTNNYKVHYEMTGPEIWNQMDGKIDAFVMSSGTGGTIAGVSKFLKEKNPAIKVFLADPNGSSLYHKVIHNVCYTVQQSERTIRKHRYDSIVEGVGLDRITQNFNEALVDSAFKIEDQEIVNTAHWLLLNEGLLLGSSTSLNIAAAIRASQLLPENSNIVTIICDQGSRHLSRFWNEEYLKTYNLKFPQSEPVIFPISSSNL